MKKILFPTDFSETATQAFQYAIGLAKDLKGVLDVMAVYHLPMADAGNIPPEYTERLLTEKKKEVHEKLMAFASKCPKNQMGNLRTDYGLFIAQEIADTARFGQYDLIVMGTKGERNSIQKMLGSVTTHLMMQAPCPVLAIPGDAQYQGIRQVAYATDFQPSEQLAVKKLFQFARALEAKVQFVHVTKGPSHSREDLFLPEKYPEAFHAFHQIKSPSVMEGLDQFIQEKDIDLLAIYIPKRRLWERLFHQRFSKHMTFHTNVPLFVFHQ